MDSERRKQLQALLTEKLHEVEGVFTSHRHTLREKPDTFSLIPEEGAQTAQEVFMNAQLVQVHGDARVSLQDALRRLKAGTYGTCTECLDEIPVHRLQALPFAARCLECQEEIEGTGHAKSRRFPRLIITR